MLLLCFKLSPYLVGNTRDTSPMYEKAKFVCLYVIRPQKMKFESVQINMKHVLYTQLTNTKTKFAFLSKIIHIVLYELIHSPTPGFTDKQILVLPFK